jgi:type I restriction enzyme S subunit
MIELGDICEFKYGFSLPEKERISGSFPVYGSNGIVGWHNQPKIKGPGIIIGRKGSIGKMNLSIRDFWPIDTTYYIDTFRKPTDLIWFFYLLSTLKLDSMNKAAAVPGLNRNDVYKLKVNFPTLSEQKKIASILEKADILRQKRKQANEMLDQLLQSVFLEMFGDLEINNKDWELFTLENLIAYGPQNGIYKHEKDYGKGVCILRIDSFYNGEVTNFDLKRVDLSENELKKYQLLENEIVINRVNSPKYLGKCTIIPKFYEPTVYESNMMRFKLNEEIVNPKFAVKVLCQPFVKKQIMGRAKDAVNQSSINQEDIKSFIIPVPPLPIQNKFVSIVEKIQTLKEKAKKAEIEINNLFNSLMQKAFNGGLEMASNFVEEIKEVERKGQLTMF